MLKYGEPPTLLRKSGTIVVAEVPVQLPDQITDAFVGLAAMIGPLWYVMPLLGPPPFLPASPCGSPDWPRTFRTCGGAVSDGAATALCPQTASAVIATITPATARRLRFTRC